MLYAKYRHDGLPAHDAV